MADTQTTENKHCGGCTSKFNYCLFSKLLVAFPALSLIAYIPTALFSTPQLQVAGAVGAVGLAIYAAIWLDKHPALQGKVKLCAK